VSGRPALRAISPDASPEEVAAIVAALGAVTSTGGGSGPDTDAPLHEWVHGSRLGARRAGLQRGPWRLSGRIGRRHRA
jgi:acyl-CoA carboxylase epsilon subunit